MNKFLVIALLLVGFTLSIVYTPFNIAGTMDNVPEPQVKPLEKKDVL